MKRSEPQRHRAVVRSEDTEKREGAGACDPGSSSRCLGVSVVDRIEAGGGFVPNMRVPFMGSLLKVRMALLNCVESIG